MSLQLKRKSVSTADTHKNTINLKKIIYKSLKNNKAIRSRHPQKKTIIFKEYIQDKNVTPNIFKINNFLIYIHQIGINGPAARLLNT